MMWETPGWWEWGLPYGPLDLGAPPLEEVLEGHGPAKLLTMLVHDPCRAVRLRDVHTCVRHRERPIVSFLAEGLPASPGTATPWRRSEVAVRVPHPANPRPNPGGSGCRSPLAGTGLIARDEHPHETPGSKRTDGDGERRPATCGYAVLCHNMQRTCQLMNES